MNTRCYNSKAPDYTNYGLRGISICPAWLGNEGFETFSRWALANGYDDSLTIDRINVDGDYIPDNCRWITRVEQNRNRRNVVRLTYGGETLSCAEWSKKLGLCVGTVNNRLHKGWSVEECLFGKREAVNFNKEDCCNLRRGEQ
jgi:hypothetical protein